MSQNLSLLQTLAEQPAVQQWVGDLINYVRLQITDSGEEFTVLRQGQRLAVAPGFVAPVRRPILFGLFDPGDWYAKQFILPLNSNNLQNFAGFFTDKVVDERELYRIMAVLQPVLLAAALRMPAMHNRWLLSLFRLDTHWHQCLLDPNGNETQSCTVQFANGRWTVTPGYHGVAQRKKVLTAPKLLDFQKRVHQAESENSLRGWLALASWYRTWLDSISVPITQP